MESLWYPLLYSFYKVVYSIKELPCWCYDVICMVELANEEF